MIKDIGDQVALDVAVRDLTGALIDATMSLVVVKPPPSNATLTPTPTRLSLGLYEATVIPDIAGEWTYTWTASGASIMVQDGQFTVRSRRALVASLQELKQHLRINTTTEDDRLRDVLEAVTDMMEPVVGPVTPRVVTEYINLNSSGTITPRLGPLNSVTSLTTQYGSVIDASGYIVDTFAGAINLLYGFTSPNATIVYTAGHNPWPAALKYAGLIICQHEWQVRNGNGGRPVPDLDALAMLPSSGFLVPNRALELMRNYIVPAIC